MAAVIVALVGVLISLFLNTRLGLSIRATGDNPDMVRASSINTGMMITIGLCVANALTGLSGGLLAQYQKSCDINLGTGMVTIALASLIIGDDHRKGQHVKAGHRRDSGKLSIPFYRGGGASPECPGRVLKAGILHYCGGGDRFPLPEEAGGVLPAETGGKKRRMSSILRNYCEKNGREKEEMRDMAAERESMLIMKNVSKTFNPGTVNEKCA